MNTAQGNTVIGQHVSVVFQVLAHLGGLCIFQKRTKCLKHCVAIQLIRRARVIMREGHVGGGAGFYGKGHANHFRDHVVEARRLGIKGKQLSRLKSGKPVIENRLLQDCGDLD